MCRNVATQEAYIPGFLCTDIFRVYAEIFIFGEIYTPDSMSSVGRNYDVNLLSWPPRISVPAGKTTTEWKYWSSMSWTMRVNASAMFSYKTKVFGKEKNQNVPNLPTTV